MLISINSTTNGKYKKVSVNGRPHLQTTMMPIRGDTAMNGIFYPNGSVKESFMQLNKLPAPNGHPKVNGVHISAFDPVAMNAHNVGAFIRNPKMKGKKVFADVLIDLTVANTTDDGKEIVNRIETGGKLGVSTGLAIAQVANESGTDDLGADYTRVGTGFTFDHVAILLNEAAAGEHAGTEMILNTEDKDDPIFVVNLKQSEQDFKALNELTSDEIYGGLRELAKSSSAGDYVWISEVFPESKSFIFTIEQEGQAVQMFKQSYAVDDNDALYLLDDRAPVKRVIEFVTTNHKEDQDMNKDLLISFIIANTLNAFTDKDKDRLIAMNESDLVSALCVATDEPQAREILTNAGFDFAAYDNFVANQDRFEAFITAEDERLDTLRSEITAINSEYTPEMLADKAEPELLLINKTVKGGKTATRVSEGNAPAADSNEALKVNASEYEM